MSYNLRHYNPQQQSRKIAKNLIDDLAFRWLAVGNYPDFRTISEFRRRHLQAIQGLFTQIPWEVFYM